MKEKIIYEVLRIIDAKPLFLEDHLSRMENSFHLINEKMPFDKSVISNKLKELIENEKKSEGNIKITYSINGKELKIFFIPHSYPTKIMYDNGVKTILYFGERSNPNAKIVSDEFRNKVNEKIKEKDAYEAILIDRNDFITEGSRSNIFAVKNNIVITSPLKAVLPGVTRKIIIDIIKENNIKFEEREMNYKEINHVEGMFISGTSPKILPISYVDDIKINTKNEIIIDLMEKYNKKVDNYIKKCI